MPFPMKFAHANFGNTQTGKSDSRNGRHMEKTDENHEKPGTTEEPVFWVTFIHGGKGFTRFMDTDVPILFFVNFQKMTKTGFSFTQKYFGVKYSVKQFMPRMSQALHITGGNKQTKFYMSIIQRGNDIKRTTHNRWEQTDEVLYEYYSEMEMNSNGIQYLFCAVSTLSLSKQ